MYELKEFLRFELINREILLFLNRTQHACAWRRLCVMTLDALRADYIVKLPVSLFPFPF